jgi:hypothetical protein
VFPVVGPVSLHGVAALVFYRHCLADLGDSEFGEHRRVGGKPQKMGPGLVDTAIAERELVAQRKPEFAEPAVVGS